MGWLNKLFGKEKELHQINIGNLPDWLAEKTKETYSSFEKKSAEYLEQVKTAFNSLKEKIPELENAELKDADKIQTKVKSVVLGHRGNYVRLLNQLINSLELPNNTKYRTVLEFLDKTEKAFNNFSKNSTKSYYASQHLFHKEMEEIGKSISNIDNLLKNIRKSAEKSNLIKINKLKEQIKDMEEQIIKKENLKKQAAETEKKLQQSESSRQTAEKKMNELSQGPEFRKFNNLKQELNGTKNDILQLETKIIQLFSPLERSLKKFSRITLKHDKLAEAYVSDTVNALLSDKELKIIDILQNMKKSILTNSIELKDKQKEKTLETINSISKEQLAGFVYKHSTLQEKKESFEIQIKANRALNMKKELQYKLEHAEQMSAKIKNQISEIEKNTEKINIEKLKTDLQNNLSETLKQEIKITLN